MELPTPRTAAVMAWLLLLCLATSGVLQALGQSTSGFISIDCGLPGETGYVEADTLLSYTTDAGFIDTGSNHNVSAEYILTTVRRIWYTVRSFPSGARNCYTLGSLVAGLKYLIRAKFFYGDYDGLNRPPTFDLYVGVDFWRTVDAGDDPSKSNNWLAEVIVVVPRDSVQVCLVNTGNGVPFISGLDLRPLTNKLYPLANATQGLVLLHRINFGSGIFIGYPFDPYDRYWLPFRNSTPTPWVAISTRRTVQIGDNEFQPPEAVMQTAITTGDISSNIDFTLNLKSSPSDRSLGYVQTMYFSELQQLRSNSLRAFDVYRNGFQTATAYTPIYLEATFRYSPQPFQASEYRVSLNATATSTLPPIINAMELFSVIPTTVGTDSEDEAGG